jgi:hypothetical protein
MQSSAQAVRQGGKEEFEGWMSWLIPVVLVYLGGRDLEDCSSRLAQAKNSRDPHLNQSDAWSTLL